MITVSKNKDIKVVTLGAYETFYKPLGYQPVITNLKKEEPKKETPKEDVEDKGNAEEKKITPKGSKKKLALEDDLL